MSLVSVIIPTYNAAGTIVEAIHSALSQKNVEIDVFVVDDGSEDETYALLGQFGTRISVIKRQHQGISAARNAALRLVTTPYVAFLDADDLWSSMKLQTQLCFLQRYSKAVLTYSRALLMDKEGRCLTPSIEVGGGQSGLNEVADGLVEGNMLPIITVLARTDALREIGGFDPQVGYAEDWDAWFRMARRGPFHFYENSLACYRMRSKYHWAIPESDPCIVDILLSIVDRYAIGKKAELGKLEIYAKACIYSLLLHREFSSKKYLEQALTINPNLVRKRFLNVEYNDFRYLPDDEFWELVNRVNRFQDIC